MYQQSSRSFQGSLQGGFKSTSSSLQNHSQMILGMIYLITHDKTTLGAMEGQVLDDSKNTNITKEEDESCQFISNLTISIHDYTLRGIDKQASLLGPIISASDGPN